MLRRRIVVGLGNITCGDRWKGLLFSLGKKVLRRISNTILRFAVKHDLINTLSHSERGRQNVIGFNGIVESQSGSSWKWPQRDLVPIPLSQAGMSLSRASTEFKNSTQAILKKNPASLLTAPSLPWQQIGLRAHCCTDLKSWLPKPQHGIDALGTWKIHRKWHAN